MSQLCSDPVGGREEFHSEPFGSFVCSQVGVQKGGAGGSNDKHSARERGGGFCINLSPCNSLHPGSLRYSRETPLLGLQLGPGMGA